MVDKNVDLPQYKRAGAILTLNTDDARARGHRRRNRADARRRAGAARISPARRRVTPRSYTWAEQLARFATDPAVSGLLLTLGMLGLLIEMQTLHGIAGLIGVGALALFFGTHVYAGFSNGFVDRACGARGPRHPVGAARRSRARRARHSRAAARCWSPCSWRSAYRSSSSAIETIATAIVLTVIVFSLDGARLAAERLGASAGAAAAQGPDYVDQRRSSAACAAAPARPSAILRPAGIASIDGRRVDVLTEGEFIAQGTPIRVVRVEGARIFVEPVTAHRSRFMIAVSGAIVIVIIVVIAFFAFLYYFPIGLWIRTIAAGVPLGIIALVRMRLIGIPPGVIVTNYVRARKAGLNLTVDQMQSHFLAGGNVENVTLAMIAAQRAQIPLEWQRAAAIDLAGRNVLEALQTSVNPKVIETPIFQGVAQNGIQLNVKARITVRSNLDRYVGGAGEPTIIARVGEGVVSAVGAAVDHKEVLEYPDRISKAVLAKGLDAGTAFEIVSIDIADVDVGKNIGAELQTSQAEADRRIAQAKAAERQYAAQAAEQEQKAETQAMRAKVVEAEAPIPQAIAEAFRSGNLGVMDYYRLKNIQADTEMRGVDRRLDRKPRRDDASAPPLAGPTK